MHTLKNAGLGILASLKNKNLRFNPRALKKNTHVTSQILKTSDKQFILTHQEIVGKIDTLIAQMDTELEEEQHQNKQFSRSSISI